MSETTLPEPARHLSAESRALWRTLVDGYELAPHELKLLRLALEAFDRANQARRAIRRHGTTYADRWGQPHARPEVKIEADARAAFARLLAQLGLPEPEEEAPAYGRPKRDPRTGRYSRAKRES